MLDAEIGPALALVFCANAVCWLLAVWICLGVFQTPIYHPITIYLIYHFLGFVLRPILILLSDGSTLWMRIGFSPTVSSLFVTFLVTNICLLFVVLGFVVAHSRRSPIKLMPSYQFIVRKETAFLVALIILATAGLYSTWMSFAGAGLETVLSYQTSVDASGGQRLVGTSGYFTALAEFIPVMCVFLLFTKKYRAIGFALIAVFVSMKLFAGAQRLSFVIILVAIFMMYHIRQGLRYPRLLPIALIMLGAFVFDILGNDRYAMRRIIAADQSISQIIDSYIENRAGAALTSDIVEFDVATASISYIHENSDYSLGTQYLRLIIWPIPRQIWPDKPVYTSIVDLNDHGNFRFLTTSLYADTFMSFGFAGLPLAMFMLGFFFQKIYSYAINRPGVVMVMFYWVIFLYMKTILRDGGVTVFYFWIFSMIAVLVLRYAGDVKVYLEADEELTNVADQR